MIIEALFNGKPIEIKADSNGAINVNATVGSTATPTATVSNALTVTTGGTIASGCRSINFRPATGVTAAVMGYPITANVDTVLEVPGALLPAITYTVTGGNMTILEIR